MGANQSHALEFLTSSSTQVTHICFKRVIKLLMVCIKRQLCAFTLLPKSAGFMGDAIRRRNDAYNILKWYCTTAWHKVFILLSLDFPCPCKSQWLGFLFQPGSGMGVLV
jgi:hypothetical protein